MDTSMNWRAQNPQSVTVSAQRSVARSALPSDGATAIPSALKSAKAFPLSRIFHARNTVLWEAEKPSRSPVPSLLVPRRRYKLEFPQPRSALSLQVQTSTPPRRRQLHASLATLSASRFGASSSNTSLASRFGAMAMGMMPALTVLVLLLSHGTVLVQGVFQRPKSLHTHRPVIGVLTLPEPGCLRYGDQVIATSNARWLQAGGARVVPIFFDSSPAELEFVLNRVNGVFWTGGAVSFNPHTESHTGSTYLRTTEYILKHVMSENRQGRFYPLWGTCLGFERLLQLIAQDEEAAIVEEFDAENYPINLGFTDPAWHSRLFRSMTQELFSEVASPLGRLAFNNHGLGVHPESFRNNTELNRHLEMLSVDLDRNGKPFVSTVEGKQWPLYATQWHPEKAPWEWNPEWKIERNDMAIQLSNYFGRYFVNECKYNQNQFESAAVEDRMLLHNWVSIPSSVIHRLDPSVSIPFSEIYCIDRNQPLATPAPVVHSSPALRLKRFPLL